MVLRARVPSRRDRRVGHGRPRRASVRGVPLRDGARAVVAVPGRANGGRGDVGIVGPNPRAGGRDGRARLRAADRRHQHARRDVQLATGGALVPGTVRFEGVVWQAFVYPALLGAVAGGAGGALGVLRADARVSAWLVGGWRMLLAALGLAAVGILLLAAVRPQGLATYTRVVSANGARSALLLVGHHALVLPNQSFLVVAPSMGGCTSLSGPGGTVPLVCPGTLPALDDPALIPSVARANDAGTSAPDQPTRSMPPGYWTVPAGAGDRDRRRGPVGGTDVARPVRRTRAFVTRRRRRRRVRGVGGRRDVDGGRRRRPHAERHEHAARRSRWERARSRRRCSRSRGA